MRLLIDASTVQKMQRDSGQSPDSPYLFGRVTSEALDTLSVQTRGPPARPHHPKGASQEVWGLTRSLFRPSDDAVTLPYNIPGKTARVFPFGLLGFFSIVLMC